MIPDALREEEAIAHCQAQMVHYLASLWGSEVHEIEFMLATRPLHFLARVDSEERWEQLLRETSGLVHPNLYVC